MIPEILEVQEGYEPPNIIAEVAGRRMKIYKMSLESSERAIRVLEPHIGGIFDEFTKLDMFTNAVQGKKIDKKKAETEIKEVFRSRLGDLITQVPRVAVDLVMCVMNLPEKGEMTDFFWKEMSPDDLFVIVEKLDELNDFVKIGNQLFELIRYLGKRYGIDISGKVVSKE